VRSTGCTSGARTDEPTEGDIDDRFITYRGRVTLTISEIEFRSGPVVASVSMSDLSGVAVSVDQVRPLADVMMAHFSAVRASAEIGISHRILHIGEVNSSSDYEAFTRIDGLTHRFSGEADDPRDDASAVAAPAVNRPWRRDDGRSLGP